MMISRRNLMTHWRKSSKPRNKMLKDRKMTSKKLKKKLLRLKKKKL
jgi:hypothetical protein